MWGMQVRYARAASNGRSQGDESGATGQHWAVDGQELTDTLQEKNEKKNEKQTPRYQGMAVTKTRRRKQGKRSLLYVSGWLEEKVRAK